MDQLPSFEAVTTPAIPSPMPFKPEHIPPEIWIAVFQLCRKNVKVALRISHVCRYWSSVARGEPTLWTHVIIRPHVNFDQRPTELLRLQLPLTRSRSLEVVWVLRRMDQWEHFLAYSLEYASFTSRWKNLTLVFEDQFGAVLLEEPRSSQPLPELSFENLESLNVVNYFSKSPLSTHVLRAAFRAELSRVSMGPGSYFRVWTGEITNMDRITTFLLINDSLHSSLSPPRNVTRFLSGTPKAHRIPNVIDYEVKDCIFGKYTIMDLSSLKNLTVSGTLKIKAGTEVSIPTLLCLTCADIYMGEEAQLKVPNLETLRLRRPNRTRTSQERLDALETTLLHSEDSFKPITELSIEHPLRFTAICHLLNINPKLQKLRLRLQDESCARSVITLLWSLEPGPNPHTTSKPALCPTLSYVELNFDLPIEGRPEWMAMVSKIVEVRRLCGQSCTIQTYWD